MNKAFSLVLEAHLPYVKEFHGEENFSLSGEEWRFFEYVSETLLPLLGVLDRLESDHIPFRLALVMSPSLCEMLCDEHLINKYIDYTDRQIEFGKQEMERFDNPSSAALYKLAEKNYNKIIDRRIVFTERYEKNILKAIDFYRYKEKIEILASSATHSFLPFLCHNHESMQAQIEVPLSCYRRFLGGNPQGFYLPQLGWTTAVDAYLKAYNFNYTIVESHGLLFGSPTPKKGSFYPVKTNNGTFILARDYYTVKVIEKMSHDDLFLDTDRDAGFELPSNIVKTFLSGEGERHKTGYKYWSRMSGNIYDPQIASDKIINNTRLFLENLVLRLGEVSKHMKETPLCLYAGNADIFGSRWHEGPQFLETLFRMAAGYRDINFVTPSEYIFKQNLASFQTVCPEFSSCDESGYAGAWLDASNDWIYRHLARAMERMTELAERFPDDTGLKERALNQAAREMLLAQSSDWPALLYKQESTEYARKALENALRNFTTIYEALGSNYISTEWLTNLERRHSIFPHINYRVFRRKNNGHIR